MTSKRHVARLAVWLHDELVGHFTELPNDASIFTFDAAYIRNAQRSVLSLSFYTGTGEFDGRAMTSQMKLPPFFSNLLPEGELRIHVANLAGVKQVRDLPLLHLLGEDLPGAVIVRSEDEPASSLDPEGQELLPLGERKGDSATRLRFSLAGVHMKFSGSGSPEKGLTIPAGGRGGHWILKVPSSQYANLPENEHSMMRFAAEVGINVAENGLVPAEEIDGIPERFRTSSNALWVKRFDRLESSGRVHMEDFNQLYRQMPAAKYKNYSYGNMAADLARISGADDVREFVRRLVFNAAIGNADMHLKNWTLLYKDRRTPSLSPAYDLVSTIAYIDDFDQALSVAHEKDVRRFDASLLRGFAERLPVPRALVIDTADSTAERIVQTWPHIAPSLPMPSDMKDKVTQRLRDFPLTARFL